MVRYTVRRLLFAIPVILLTSIIVFTLMRLAPGDVITASTADQGTLTDAEIERLQKELGLDDPPAVQYLRWIGGIATGDLGYSIYTRESIASALGRTAPVTLQLAVLGIALSILVGIPIGLISAMRRGGPTDQVLRSVSILGLCAPDFWTATLAVTFLGLWFHWVPPLGRNVFWDDPVATLAQLAVPSIIVGYRLSASVARMTRSTVLEVIREDYVRTARAKGLQASTIWTRHVLRNSLAATLTILGGQVIVLIGGTVIIETIFALPGMGRLTLSAIQFRDYPLVQTIVFLFAIVVIVVNLAVDLSYAWLDPRIRYS